jgi:hypothetical protein
METVGGSEPTGVRDIVQVSGSGRDRLRDLMGGGVRKDVFGDRVQR